MIEMENISESLKGLYQGNPDGQASPKEIDIEFQQSFGPSVLE